MKKPCELALTNNEKEPSLKGVYAGITINEADIVAALHQAGQYLSPKESTYHITLRFIHSIERLKLPELIEAIRTICGSHESFKLTLSSPGFFPEGIAYYGIETSPALMVLQADIDRAVIDFGLPVADYIYNPHITLAKRVTEPKIIAVPAETWLVDSLEIRQSIKGSSNLLLDCCRLS